MELELREGYGAERPWVAEITGIDQRYGLARAFIPLCLLCTSRSGKVKRWGFRTQIPGLYEIRHAGDQSGYRIVWQGTDGELQDCRCSDPRARLIAELLEAGEEFEAARRATRVQRR